MEDISNLDDLNRKELQALAKKYGIKANGKSASIIEELMALKSASAADEPSKEEEAEEEQAVVEESAIAGAATEEALPVAVAATAAAAAEAEEKEDESAAEEEVKQAAKEAVEEAAEESTVTADISDVLDITVLRGDDAVAQSPYRFYHPKLRTEGKMAVPPTPAADILSPPMTVIRRYLSRKSGDNLAPAEDCAADDDEENYHLHLRGKKTGVGLPPYTGKKTFFASPEVASPACLKPINWNPDWNSIPSK